MSNKAMFAMRIYPKIRLISRIVLASFGAYIVAMLVAILPLALPMDDVSAVAWGYILAVPVAALAFIGVFLISTLQKAWLVMGGIIAVLCLLCGLFVPNFVATMGVL